MRCNAKKKGFSIFEIMLVIAIISIIGTVGAISASSFQTKQNLRLTMDELIAAIRDTRQKSITQENGKPWGVRFNQTESGKGQYVIFSGTSSESGTVTQTVSLRRNIQFGEFCGISTSSEITFQSMTGKVASLKNVILSTGSSRYPVGSITIDTLGRVYSQLETGVLGRWSFTEETGETACDASGNGAIGTLVGTPTWQNSCKVNSCISFGGNSHVLIGPSEILSFSGDFSISFLEKVSATTTRQIPFSISDWDFGDNLDFNFNDNQNPSGIMVFWGGNRISEKVIMAGSVGQYTDGAWHYIALTRSNSTLSLYVDGEIVATGIFSGIIGSETNPLMVGRANHSPGHHWKGMIDEVYLYNRALSTEEIAATYEKLK